MRQLTIKQKSKTQAEKAEEKEGSDQHVLHIEFDHLLKTITARVSLWKDDSVRYLRNFCHAVINNPLLFPPMMGDSAAQLAIHSGGEDKIVAPTKGYIAAFAAGNDTTALASDPILTVMYRKTGFQDVMQHENTNTHQKVK